MFSGQWPMILMIVGMFVIMYFLMIRPQSKQRKAEEQMRNSIEAGDEITTIGGIMGKVVSVKDDSLIIETGVDRNKMKITRWAVQQNVTKAEAQKEANEAARIAKQEAKAAAKEEKMKKKNNKEK